MQGDWCAAAGIYPRQLIYLVGVKSFIDVFCYLLKSHNQRSFEIDIYVSWMNSALVDYGTCTLEINEAIASSTGTNQFQS
jgi:hypothetical protein